MMSEEMICRRCKFHLFYNLIGKNYVTCPRCNQKYFKDPASGKMVPDQNQGHLNQGHWHSTNKHWGTSARELGRRVA